MANKRINIAIDGYSSCGKGTLARYLAESLDYVFIDSGAMYRGVTLFALQNGIDPEDESAVEDVLPQINLHFKKNAKTGRNELFLNDENVEGAIRGMEVAGTVSRIAKISAVRKFLVAMQQKIAQDKGVVMDGRDIGTVVLPNAELKIFMTASPEVRAGRRFKELVQAGVETTYEAVLNNLAERDRIDSSRKDSPLTLTQDYKVLDNSNLSIEQQNNIALAWVDEALHNV